MVIRELRGVYGITLVVSMFFLCGQKMTGMSLSWKVTTDRDDVQVQNSMLLLLRVVVIDQVFNVVKCRPVARIE